MNVLTELQKFKLEIITNFIGCNTLDDKTRIILLQNAITFVENDDTGFSFLTNDDIENLKVLEDFTDSESDLRKTLTKLLILV